VALEGTRSSRDGLGATVVVAAGGRKQARAVLSQTSYYSHDDLRLHFGLGAHAKAESVEVHWPSGQVDVHREVAARQVFRVREGAAAAQAAKRGDAGTAKPGNGEVAEPGAEKVAPSPVLADLDGRPVEPLAGLSGKAVVFVFVKTDCPISNRYAPEVRRLQEKFEASGVSWRVVYTEPDGTADDVRRHLKQFGLPEPALVDARHALVKATGAKVTPEAAVFVPDGSGTRLVYRGRIDDRYASFGRMRPAPTSRELEDAIVAVLEGRAVAKATVPAIGCAIAEAP
jgi:hypothetical protein